MNDVTYKGHTLSAIALSEHNLYSATVFVRAPSGDQRCSTLMGRFPSAILALGYAFKYGMAVIDCRPAPAYE
ncbi:hypothetical protein [Caballeronia grimmiae]|uniref:hypothetical protein n=1 Tax=Caballeronia grimmiae TaxID=1071679 RepID=UPI0038BD53CF